MSQLSFDFNAVTALGPDDPDDGDEGRQRRGMAIAALVRVERNRLGYKVPSQSGKGSYVVNTDDTPFCTCPDFERRQLPCKHVYAVEFIIQREERPDGTTFETRTTRVTYRQEWAAYNAAQEHEQEHFVQLLRELCDTVEQPPRSKGAGRPRLPLSDTVFGSALKVYSTMSTRRAMTDMRNAQSAGLLNRVPSTASTWRCMENPDLTPLLESLIQMSALPLRAVEHDFAADSTAFATSVYHRWFDHKWNKMIEEATWVKAHAMCGVKTNIITAAKATAGESADATRFAPFVETTAQHFTINEVSADKAYLSKKKPAGGRGGRWGQHTSRSSPTRPPTRAITSAMLYGNGPTTTTTSTVRSSCSTTTRGLTWKPPSPWSRPSSVHRCAPRCPQRRSMRCC